MQAFGPNQTPCQPSSGGGLFLKSDSIGFQISPAFGGIYALKGHFMKSATADFIADSLETTQRVWPQNFSGCKAFFFHLQARSEAPGLVAPEK
jgi:hypothetical protein